MYPNINKLFLFGSMTLWEKNKKKTANFLFARCILEKKFYKILMLSGYLIFLSISGFVSGEKF